MSAAPLVIVGASYAGTQLADSLRQRGYEAPIVMLGEEPHPPYQRPPLSKGVLSGKTSVANLAIKGPDFFHDQQIDLRLGVRATALDTAQHTLTLAGGQTLPYRAVVLATGARCRPLPCADAELAGVYSLRSLDDAQALLQALPHARRACIIGGGFIGLETAASLASQGIAVTVLEHHRQLLARSLPASLAEFLAAHHAAQGVDLRLGCAVTALHSEQGRVCGLSLSDGQRLDCDLVVVGIGVLPNSELAQQAGIACDNGILTDASGRTSHPDVLAIGDVANVQQAPGAPFARLRLESIQAANDGARAAAAALMGEAPPAVPVPWFWSDQYHLKLQMAGLPQPGDLVVQRGQISADRFSLFYLRDGRLAAAHSINRPGEHMLSRKLIGAAVVADPAQLSDESFDLKQLIGAS